MAQSIGRVAIVNRGDAATRFLHAARDHAEATGERLVVVALYAEGEENARFVRDADERVCLGPAQVTDDEGRRRLAYLDHAALERALVRARVDAVWPGWGFVSEDPAFVDLCERLGITFIGPSADAMRLLGDKVAAKQLAESVGVPVACWSGGPLDSLDDAVAEAGELGYPLMIKAAGGGGGRGIRKIVDENELRAMFPVAVHEATHAFGDPRVFLESLVPDARHIEVQIAADVHGGVWALGLRDCTLQRRHQKVLEEAGTDLLPAVLQEEMQEGAVRLCRAAGYRNVGTVEFLIVPETGHWYFMEVNPRLQVEHTVTEVVTGVDLVRLQLAIAAGEALGDQAPAARGHAIQVRLNAEHPHTLAPAPGRLLVFETPDGPGVRIDTGFREGDVVPPEYDSMIAKVIASGRDRAEALARLRRALAGLAVLVDKGATNRSFLARLLRHPVVVADAYDTGWIDRVLLHEQDAPDPALALVVAAVETHRQRTLAERRHFASTARRGRPEANPDESPVQLQYAGVVYDLEVRQIAPDRFQVRPDAAGAEPGADEACVDVRWEPLGRSRTRVGVAGREADVVCAEHGADLYLEIGDQAFVVSRGDAGLVRASSPGVVISLAVAPGDLVEPGDVLAVVEAMKLETSIFSQVGGKVAEVLAPVNVQVDAGDPLLRLALSSDTGDNWAPAAPAATRAHFSGLAGSCAATDPGARMLGYDTPFGSSAALPLDPSRALSLFRDLCGLTHHEAHHAVRRERGLGEVLPGGERLFLAFLRSPERAGELLPPEYEERLNRLLGWYVERGVRAVPGEPDEALLRLFRARQRLAASSGWLVAMLREVHEGRRSGDWLDRDVLDELIGTTETAFPAVAEWARAVRSRLFELPAHEHAATSDKPDLPAELDQATCEMFELWRLDAFGLTPRPAPAGVLLVHAVARDNPADERLFAFVQIDDVTHQPGPGDQAGGSFPVLERRLREAVAAIRHERLGASARPRPTANRVVATVGPVWHVSDAQMKGIAQRLADAAQGLDLEKVLVRTRILDEPAYEAPEPVDTVVHMVIPHALGVSVGRSAPSDRLVASRTTYQQRVARLRSRGAMSPYEIVDLLVAPSARDADFPLGRFVEHDLVDGVLVPVTRPYGENTANLVVGIIENRTTKHPEGMRRVILLGDPAKGLGALAEPECRRVIAALHLAEQLDVPVEWFTVSSGAKVAMDSGTENLDWTAAALRRIIEFTQSGREINVVVVGVNVGAQAYFDAEATMLMHTRGALVMVPQGAMVLTGKQALDASGGVSAEDNTGIGGFERVMGPNGQAQYWAPDVPAACATLFRYYETAYAAPGEAHPRPRPTSDPATRDIGAEPHPATLVPAFTTIGAVFSDEHNAERKKPFDISAVMRAVSDADATPLERWAHWEGAETGIVWDTHLGGRAVSLLGIESRNVRRRGALPADGPRDWTAGTLFPNSSKKLARALNSASGNRPVVVLANLSGFDGSPESMRELQLESGAELGRAVVNFRGPIVFCVLSRYHGGAFVVFSKRLNPTVHVVAVDGARASVLGGTPAASVVFTREVNALVAADPRVQDLTARLADAPAAERSALRAQLEDAAESIRAEAIGRVAAQFDGIHTIERAREVGSIDAIIPIGRLRAHVIAQLDSTGEVPA